MRQWHSIALQYRHLSGKGQAVDVSLYDVMVRANYREPFRWEWEKAKTPRMGNFFARGSAGNSDDIGDVMTNPLGQAACKTCVQENTVDGFGMQPEQLLQRFRAYPIGFPLAVLKRQPILIGMPAKMNQVGPVK